MLELSIPMLYAEEMKSTRVGVLFQKLAVEPRFNDCKYR